MATETNSKVEDPEQEARFTASHSEAGGPDTVRLSEDDETTQRKFIYREFIY